MKQLFYVLCTGLVMIAWPLKSHAQWTWSSGLEIGVIQNQNIFKSPSRLLIDDQWLGVDSLFQNDLTIPFDFDLDLIYKKRRHRFKIDLSSSMDRYGRYNNLNGSLHQIRLEDTWDVSSKVELFARVEGRHSRRVGTNVLGDQLPRLFEYKAVGASVGGEWQYQKRKKLSLSYRWQYRDYTESEGSLSLDSHNQFMKASWVYRTPRKKGQYKRAEVDLQYRTKSYLDYAAREDEGLQDEEYPLNYLQYFTLGFERQRGLSRKWIWEWSVGGRYRRDRFENYYTYYAGTVGLEVNWRPNKRMEFQQAVDWQLNYYPVKDAPQASDIDYPNLQYHYLDWRTSLEYAVNRATSLLIFVESDNRFSNVTLASYRVRRSYNTIQGGLTILLDVDQLAKRGGK